MGYISMFEYLRVRRGIMVPQEDVLLSRPPNGHPDTLHRGGHKEWRKGLISRRIRGVEADGCLWAKESNG